MRYFKGSLDIYQLHCRYQLYNVTKVVNDNKKTKISLIIPVFNEEQALEMRVKYICEYLKTVTSLDDFEIVVVNNGSTDKTQEILDIISKRFASVVPVYIKQRGLGLALKRGLIVAKFDCIMFVSIDLGFGAKFIKQSIDKYFEGFDLVLGSKGHKDSIYEAPISRKMYSYIFNNVVKLIFDIKCSDTQGTFLISKKCRSEIIDMLDSPGPFFQTQVVIYANKINARIFELPVIYKAGSRKSKMNVVDAMQIFLEVIKEYPNYKSKKK